MSTVSLCNTNVPLSHRLLTFLLFISITQFSATGKSIYFPISCSPTESECPIEKNLWVFRETSPTATDSVLSFPENYFRKEDNFSFQFGYNQQANWVLLPIQNTSDEEEELFFVIQNAMLQFLDFYLLNDDTKQIIQQTQTGFGRPYAMRSIDERYFVFKIKLLPKQSYLALFKARNEAGNVMLPIRLFNLKGYLHHQSFHHDVTTVTFSIWLIASIVAITLFFMLKETIYIFYFGYVFCLLLYWSTYEGMVTEYLSPNTPYISDIMRNCYVPAAIFFNLFAMSLLTTYGRRLKKVRKVGFLASIAFIPVTAMIAIPPALNPFRNQLVAVNDILLVVLVVNLLIAIFFKIREKNEYSRLLILALSPMLFYTLFQILTFRDVLPISRNNFFLQYGFGICALIEIFLMFILLGYRIKHILEVYQVTQKKLDAQVSSPLEDYKEALKIKKEKPSYLNSKLTESQLKEILTRVETILTQEKTYKNPSLTLQKLAEMASCTPHVLSQCINQIAGSNFNDYINSFRIKESEDLLVDPECNHLSIDGIGSMVGFASKTSFYTAFKKTHGQTPKEFKLMASVEK